MRSIYLISGAFKLLNKNKAYQFVEINTSYILKLNNVFTIQESIPKKLFWDKINSHSNLDEILFIPGNNSLDIVNNTNNFLTEEVVINTNNVTVNMHNKNNYNDQELNKAFFVINEDYIPEDFLHYYTY
jgi:hypothetical protein